MSIFGFAVSIAKGTVAVGAFQDDSDQGSAYVFVQPAAGWTGMTGNGQTNSKRHAEYRLFRMVCRYLGKRGSRGSLRHEQSPRHRLCLRETRNGLGFDLNPHNTT